MNKDQMPLPGLDQPPQPVKDDCYFYDRDRCLARPAEWCNWSVKIGEWEWLCAYPWKGGLER